MAFVLASADSTNGYIYLETNWVDTPAVEHVRFIRMDPDGNETVVRVHTSADDTGQYIELSDGMAIVYDTQAPFGVIFTYRVEALETSGYVVSAPVTLVSDGNVWLKDPIYPGHDQLLIFTLPGDPACVPGNGIFFVGLGQQDRSGRGGAVVISNSKYPVPLVRVRGSISSTLTLVTRTFTDRDDLEILLDPGTVLLLQAPPEYGIGDRYIHIPGDVAESRPLTDHRKPWRIFSLPHVVVLEPAGLMYGVYGSRWIDVCDTYATFADATAASLEWQAAMQGAAGPAGVGVDEGWRTWADVVVDFASWTAVNTGGRTWQQLLEGQ